MLDGLLKDRKGREKDHESLLASVTQKRERLLLLSKQKKEMDSKLRAQQERVRLTEKSLNALHDACEQEEEIKRQHHDTLLSVQSVLPILEKSLATLNVEHQKAEEELQTSKREYDVSLLKKKTTSKTPWPPPSQTSGQSSRNNAKLMDILVTLKAKL